MLEPLGVSSLWGFLQCTCVNFCMCLMTCCGIHWWCQFIVRVPPVYMCQFLHVSDHLLWYTLMVSVHCEWFLLCAFVNPYTWLTDWLTHLLWCALSMWGINNLMADTFFLNIKLIFWLVGFIHLALNITDIELLTYGTPVGIQCSSIYLQKIPVAMPTNVSSMGQRRRAWLQVHWSGRDHWHPH